LFCARDGEAVSGRIFGQRGAGTQGRASADGDRRDELSIAADERIVFDDGAVFVGTVVIASNRAGTNVDARSDRGITDRGAA
jgi:hypothetical protein